MHANDEMCVWNIETIMEFVAGISGYYPDDKMSLSSTPPVKPVCTDSGCYSLPFTKQKSCLEVATVFVYQLLATPRFYVLYIGEQCVGRLQPSHRGSKLAP